MTNTISNYNELLEEQQRLTLLLRAQKELIRRDLNDIKEELAPVKTAISIVSKLATKDNSSILLTTAADTLIDVIIKRMLLSKAGWITKLAIPFVMKNFSSHIIADNKDHILNKLFSWFGKKANKENGKEKEEVEEKAFDSEED